MEREKCSRDLTVEDLIGGSEFSQNVLVVRFAVERSESLGSCVQLGGTQLMFASKVSYNQT